LPIDQEKCLTGQENAVGTLKLIVGECGGDEILAAAILTERPHPPRLPQSCP